MWGVVQGAFKLVWQRTTHHILPPHEYDRKPHQFSDYLKSDSYIFSKAENRIILILPTDG